MLIDAGKAVLGRKDRSLDCGVVVRGVIGAFVKRDALGHSRRF